MIARSVLLTSAIQLSSTLTMLSRSIIFAHLLSPDDYGLAMTFSLVLIFCEHISNFGHDHFILRSKNGNLRSIQSTLHSTILIRGFLIGFLLIIMAPVIPIFLGLNDLNFNYAYLALIPFINAFTHLDFQRLNRQFDYVMSAKLSITSDVISIALAITLAFALQNHWAFLISLVAKHIIYVALSHILSSRSYQISWNSKHLKELIHFGWPILIISGLRYLSMEADKVMVVRYSGIRDFTSYVLTALVVTQSVHLSCSAYAKIFIRRISQAHGSSEQRHAYTSNAIILAFITTPLLFAIITLGEPIINVTFSDQYYAIAFLLPTMCALTAIRIVGYWLNHIVVASDSTQKMLICTVFRLSGFCLALLAAIQNFGLITIVGGFVIGEIIYTVSMVYLLKRDRPELPRITTYFSLVCLLNVIIATGVYWFSYNMHVQNKVIISTVFISSIIALFLLRSNVCRKQMSQVINELTTFKEKYN